MTVRSMLFNRYIPNFFRTRHIAIAVVTAYAVMVVVPIFLYAQIAESIADTETKPHVNELMQEQLTVAPSKPGLSTTTDSEREHLLNELRKELLDYRMRTVDWWLVAIGIFFTVMGILFAIIFGGVGLFALDRLREIDSKAQGYLDKIVQKHDEAVSEVEKIKATDVDERPNEMENVLRDVRANPAASPEDRIIADAIELQQKGETKKAIGKWRIIAEGTDDKDLKHRAWFSIGYLEPSNKNKISAYDKVIELAPYAFAYSNRGSAKHDLKEYDEAIADYDKAIKLDPDNAAIYNNRGNTKCDLKDYDGAIADYDKAIKLDSGYAFAYNGRGNVKRNLKDYDGAIADYDKAIKLDSDYASAYNGRGNAKRNLKDYDGAIADYDKAIELDPNNAFAYNNRGNVKRNLKDYDGAIADYDKAIELDPALAVAYNHRGAAKSALKNYAEAIADYNKAIELDPNNAAAYNNRCYAKSHLKDPDYGSAITDCDKAIELDPALADAYDSRGYAKFGSKDYIGAIADYDKAIELDPALAVAYNHRGIVNRELGKNREARMDLQHALELAKEQGLEDLIPEIQEELQKLPPDN